MAFCLLESFMITGDLQQSRNQKSNESNWLVGSLDFSKHAGEVGVIVKRPWRSSAQPQPYALGSE